MIDNTDEITAGFYSKASFRKHFATVMMYPVRNDIWRENAKYAQTTVIKLANLIINYEPVILCVPIGYHEIIKKCIDIKVNIIEIEYDDIWTGDVLSNFLVNDQRVIGICWKFNAWGGIEQGSYFPWNKDAAFAENFCQKMHIDYYVIEDFTLEGGSVITDGEGTLFTTECVILNNNRNPNISKNIAEEYLKKYFSALKIIWLKSGLHIDETDGHVDNILRFVKPGEVCVAWTDDKDDPQYQTSREVYNVLINQSDAKGRKFKINKIPMPVKQYLSSEEADGIAHNKNAIERKAGNVLPASYLNYYFINDSLLIPSFTCKFEDDEVKKIFQNIFPDREIIQIDIREILIGGGGLHCILHEIPMHKD